VLGDVAALLSHRITPFVDLIVIAVDPTARSRVRQVMDRLAALPNEVVLVVDDDGAGRHSAIRRLADAPLSPLDIVADPGRRAFAKRVQDAAFSAVLLLVLAPVFALVALAVRLDSPGPVFFRQRRHGFNNEEVVVWKFRTMRVEATDQRAERQVTAGDVRVTRVGRILRSTSLDELPQLLNVLGGSMSLVGPRPHAIGMKTGEDDSAGLVADYALRNRIKPGMTGWAAIKGSRGPLHTADDVRRRVSLDVHYIHHQSFWLDAWIMAMTVPSVFGDRSAIR
jgi:lipopolysaccharide/colanic/teichoic acid biosynthesis glycosyltransferase